MLSQSQSSVEESTVESDEVSDLYSLLYIDKRMSIEDRIRKKSENWTFVVERWEINLTLPDLMMTTKEDDKLE